jgi:hypothetical protein
MDKTPTRVDQETEDPDRIKEEIDGIRRNLGGLVDELDRRRHEAFDVRLQMRRHPLPFVLSAVVLVGVIGATVAMAVHQHREQRRLATRLRRVPPFLHRLRLALSRALDDPDRVAPKQPRVATKLLTAGGQATVATLGKRLATRLVH